jgi:predicted O-methyltransferase YrrM
MPRYFLHIRDGDELIPDEEGSDLPDLDAAREEAIQGARDILAEKIRTGDPLDGEKIEICDAQGHVLAVIPFRSMINLD